MQAAPKELARRGLEDGIERLRGQLRDTAQGRGSRHGTGPLRLLRRRSGPHKRPPSLPSRRRGHIFSGKRSLRQSRPPRAVEPLCRNRAELRPGTGHNSDGSWNLYPHLRATTALFRLAKMEGKLGGAAMLHRVHPQHRDRPCAARYKNVPVQGGACPH